MSRRTVQREYAEKECDEVCQDILARDRIELRERSRTTERCGCNNTRRCTCNDDVEETRCRTRSCDCDDWDNDNSEFSRTTRNRTGTRLVTRNRISGEECSTEDEDNCDWEDPCRCNRNRCGCNTNWNTCGCNRCRNTSCGCNTTWNRRNNRCGCSRGLNCDRNRRLRSCECNCTCNGEETE